MKRLLFLILVLFVPFVGANQYPVTIQEEDRFDDFGASSTYTGGNVEILEYTIGQATTLPGVTAVFTVNPTFFSGERDVDKSRSFTRLEVFASTDTASPTTTTNLNVAWSIEGSDIATISSCGVSNTRINIPSGATSATAGSGESRLVCDLDYRDTVFNITSTTITITGTLTPRVGVIVKQTEVLNITTQPGNGNGDGNGSFSLFTATFTDAIGFSALEFMVAPLLMFLGVILWSRSTDHALRVVGGTLPIIGGLVLFSVGLATGFGEAWIALVGFMALLMATGVYMIVRVMVDQFMEARGS